MSLVIRFATVGRKGERKYRVVVKEKRSRRDGKPVDTVGYYEKTINNVIKEVDQKKIDYWIEKGAKVSPAVDTKLFDGKYTKLNGTTA